MLDIESYLLGKKAGGGGGNPNSIQTITGNFNNPFGSIDKARLAEAIVLHNASAKIFFDTSALGVPGIYSQWLSADGDYNFYLNGAEIYAELSNSQAYSVVWTESSGYSLVLANMLMGGVITETINYADYIPTTLEIYWHPMPSGS